MPLGETRCDPFRGIALGKDGKAEEGTLLRQATRVGQAAQTAFTTIILQNPLKAPNPLFVAVGQWFF